MANLSSGISFEKLASQVRHNHPVIHTCKQCKKTAEKIRRCQGCFSVFYCNRECQTKDWAKHKIYCLQMKPLLQQLKEAYSGAKTLTPDQWNTPKAEKLFEVYGKVEMLFGKYIGSLGLEKAIEIALGEEKIFYKITDLFQSFMKVMKAQMLQVQ